MHFCAWEFGLANTSVGSCAIPNLKRGEDARARYTLLELIAYRTFGWSEKQWKALHLPTPLLPLVPPSPWPGAGDISSTRSPCVLL